MSGITGLEALEEFERKLRALSAAPGETAKEAAPLVEAALKAKADEGVDPSTGAKWPEKKAGGRALPKAASAIRVVAKGLVVVAELVGPYVHHQRTVNEKYRRRVLPDARVGLPPEVREAVAEAYRRVAARLQKG